MTPRPVRLAAPTVQFRAVPAYHRPGWVRAVSATLPAAWRGPGTDRWVARAPLAGVLLATLAVALLVLTTVDTTAATAEVEEIRRTVPAGASLHPAFAAGLDALGGLTAVRLASLVAALAAVGVLAGAVRAATGSARTEVLAAATLATAPAVLVAATTASPTAWGLLALAVAVRTGVGRSLASAVACGVALAFTVSLVPAAVYVVPAVVALLLLLRPGHLPLLGTALAVAAAGVGGCLLLGTDLPGLGFGGSALLGLVLGAGPALLLALVGAALALRERAPLAALAVAAAIVFPLLPVWSGAPAAARPGAAFAALLLAPVAGQALAGLSRTLLRWVPVVAFLLVAGITGTAVARYLTEGWADVRPAAAVAAEPGADTGRIRLSTAAESLAYTTAGTLPGVTWESTATLAAQGPDAVGTAVADRTFSLVLLQPSSADDPDRAALVAALDLSADYEKDPPLPDAHDPNTAWTVYRLIDLLP